MKDFYDTLSSIYIEVKKEKIKKIVLNQVLNISNLSLNTQRKKLDFCVKSGLTLIDLNTAWYEGKMTLRNLQLFCQCTQNAFTKILVQPSKYTIKRFVTELVIKKEGL